MRYVLAIGLFAVVLSFVSGCEKSPLGTVDSNPTPPFLIAASIQPGFQNIDSLSPDMNGNYSITTLVTATAQGATSINLSVFRPRSASPFVGFQILDDGIGSDSAANDGIFSGNIPFTLTRSQAGLYQFRVASINEKGDAGNELFLSFLVTRANAAPSLEEESLVAPDTVDLPIGGQLLILVAIAASDSDGIGDIREVAFTSLTSSTPEFKFLLKDDGGSSEIGPPFFLPSGDAVSGDGVFSILIPLIDGPTVRRTNLFSFKATDLVGAVSDSVVHFLTIR